MTADDSTELSVFAGERDLFETISKAIWICVTISNSSVVNWTIVIDRKTWETHVLFLIEIHAQRLQMNKALDKIRSQMSQFFMAILEQVTQ